MKGGAMLLGLGDDRGAGLGLGLGREDDIGFVEAPGHLNRYIKRPDGALVPEWNSVKANKIVKAIAVEMKWDPDLVWVNHGIRHAAVLDAKQKAEDSDEEEQIDAAQSRTAQNTRSLLSARGVYGRSEQDRKLSVIASRETGQRVETETHVARRGKKRMNVREKRTPAQKAQAAPARLPPKARAGGRPAKAVTARAAAKALQRVLSKKRKR
jgi:hypothetical protein